LSNQVDDREEKLTETQSHIRDACRRIETILIGKNRQYGNSVLDPVRIFSRSSTVEQILVRIDDKLSRVRTGDPSDGEDTILDLIGYLIFLWIAIKKDAAMGRTIG
jgi:hypothetical protein